MFSPKSILALALSGLLVSGHAVEPEFGRLATPLEIGLWDIDVSPDGSGLPEGRGNVAQGERLFADHCAACHGSGGEGGIKDRLVGGIGSLASLHPVKTVGSFWPYATTLYDYMRRAMPYHAPGSLRDDDYFALAAYLLMRNGLLAEGATLDRQSLPQVRMPNRDGFVPEPEFSHVANTRRLRQTWLRESGAP